MITRAEILRRARAVPQRSDSYSQEHIDTTGANVGYRDDCSGWVSYCWGCPTKGPGTWGGYSTASFIVTDWAPGVKGIMYEIPRSMLQPGDAIGHCGPNTGGNGGHIALWLGRSGSGQERILDHGGGWGPLERTITWGDGGPSDWDAPENIKAFRFRGVEGATGGESVTMPVTPATIAPGAPFPLPAGQFYGDINGAANLHGGDPRYDGPEVLATIAAIQIELIKLGFVPGASAAWADGRFEQPTITAVSRLQAARHLAVTGRVDGATWSVLFPALAPVTPPVVTPPTPTPAPTPTPEPVDMAALVAALVPLLLPAILPAILAAVPAGPAGPAGTAGEPGPRGEKGDAASLPIGARLVVVAE